MKDAKGRDYLPHTPKNPENPEWYFHTLPGIVSWDIDGIEIMVWGNYCNVIGGATPVNIYYSTDMGKTWAQYDLAEFGPRSGTRFHEKNSEGWFRLDLRTGWVTQADVMFIKPKRAAAARNN